MGLAQRIFRGAKLLDRLSTDSSLFVVLPINYGQLHVAVFQHFDYIRPLFHAEESFLFDRSPHKEDDFRDDGDVHNLRIRRPQIDSHQAERLL